MGQEIKIPACEGCLTARLDIRLPRQKGKKTGVSSPLANPDKRGFSRTGGFLQQVHGTAEKEKHRLGPQGVSPARGTETRSFCSHRQLHQVGRHSLSKLRVLV